MIATGVYQNRKTGNLYLVTGIRHNATNAQNGQVMVDYQDKPGSNYCREINEFIEKFIVVRTTEK